MVLTHSEGRLEGLASALEARGVTVVHNPLVATRPRLDDESRRRAEALLALPWLLFTSRAAVEAWQALALPLPRAPRRSGAGAGGQGGDDGGGDGSGDGGGGPRLGAVGAKTAAALQRAGGEVSLVAESPSAEGLARSFLRRRDARGPVGLPQGDRARAELRAALQRSGLDVRPAVVYDTVTLPWRAAAVGPTDVEAAVEVVVVASPSALEALPAAVAGRARLVALGPTTQRAARSRGLRARQASAPTPEALLSAVLSELAAAGHRAGSAREQEIS